MPVALAWHLFLISGFPFGNTLFELRFRNPFFNLQLSICNCQLYVQQVFRLNVTVLSPIRKALSPRSRSQLLRATPYTADWIAAAIPKIAGNLPKKARNDLGRCTGIAATAGGAAGNRKPRE
jgi:hypothetical protein